MTKIKILLLLLPFIVLSSWNCSDLNDDIVPPPEVGVHQEGTLEPSSNEFHGKLFLEESTDFTNCQSCHGGELSGGLTGIGCVSCHTSINVHKEGINTPGSTNFHATFIGSRRAFNECKACHGEDFLGSTVSPSCATCHEGIDVHVSGVIDPRSEDFHAQYLANASFDWEACRSCHGDDFGGGTVSTTCQNCHEGIGVHVDGYKSPTSENFHGNFIASINWDLRECKTCHSQDYSGGLVSPTCNDCHEHTGGPEACNTCHGNFNDPTIIAPDQGSHFGHLYEAVIASNVQCSECHTVPNNLFASSHFANSPADFSWGIIATTVTNEATTSDYDSELPEFTPTPAFTNGSCSTVYCHGYFKNGNTDNQVSWESGSAACGTCHGDPATGNPLPKTSSEGGTHFASDNCGGCHAAVASGSGAAATIIDPALHINGKLNVFGEERDY